jgi:hypothetical protein
MKGGAISAIFIQSLGHSGVRLWRAYSRLAAEEFFSESMRRTLGIIDWSRQPFLQFQFAAMHVELGFDIPGRQQVRCVLGFI